MNDRKTYLKDYLKKKQGQILPCGVVFGAFHLYFFFFIQNRGPGYLLYLDILILMPGLLWLAVDYGRFRKSENTMEELLRQPEIICRSYSGFDKWPDSRRVAEHDVQVLEGQLSRQFEENRALQDYVAKWCHEVKIPLSAALLMDEKISEPGLRSDMRGQLERIGQLLNSMLLGCRLQSSLLDLQIRRTELSECVKTSVRNNQFFLIRGGFQVQAEVGDLAVYTDPQWLVYILDQLIGNGIKYGRKAPGEGEENIPTLKIWAEKKGRTVTLCVEDYGQGIRRQDIERIFEKGYTGSNYHNGRYKSTGMGLYMVSRIAEKLGHEIRVESEEGEYTRFEVVFGEEDKFG